MKATGIVRRMDDLGRVVIPKEIRRTMRIREGDPLEIFTQQDGEVVFKKYSPLGELTPLAVPLTDVMAKTCGTTVAVTDRDRVVAVAGPGRKDLADRKISGELDTLLESRQTYTAPGEDKLRPADGVERFAAVAVPILSAGDVLGAVCVFSPEDDLRGSAAPRESELRLAQVGAGFLGKQME